MPVCLIFRGYGRNENYSKMMKTYKKTKQNNDKHVMVFKVLYVVYRNPEIIKAKTPLIYHISSPLCVEE